MTRTSVGRRGAGLALAACLTAGACSSSSSVTETASDDAPAVERASAVDADPEPLAPTVTQTTTTTAPLPALDGLRKPLERSWTVDVVRDAPSHGGAALDVYAPADEGTWPTIVLFGEAGVAIGGYEPLATTLAEHGAVVFVAAFDPARPSDASECAVAAALDYGEQLGADPGALTIVGLGDGGAIAVGESFGGPWRRWAVTGCDLEVGDGEPTAVVLVAPELDVLGGPDPGLRGLSPFDQLGGNPYLSVTLVEAADAPGADPLLDRFHTSLLDEGYDVTMVPVELPTERLTQPGEDVEILAEVISEALVASSTG